MATKNTGGIYHEKFIFEHSNVHVNIVPQSKILSVHLEENCLVGSHLAKTPANMNIVGDDTHHPTHC